jgi:hypothetical protein
MTAYTSRVHCAESGEESTETESVYSLKCHISHDVNHLHEGLKHVSNVSSYFYLILTIKEMINAVADRIIHVIF